MPTHNNGYLPKSMIAATRQPARHRVLESAMSAIFLAASQTGYAQTTDNQNENTAALEEVVVSAQRRQESLSDVPMSITAVSAEALTKAGITSTLDLGTVVPGLTMTKYSNALQPSMRGISSQNSSAGDTSSVAIYLDGVYQTSITSTIMDLPDVAQIEALKGPQGALYGQNATAGALIITTKAPSSEPEGKLTLSYGNYDDTSLGGYLSGPLGERVSASLSASYQSRDGFRKHVVSGERDSGIDSKTVRGKLLIQPTDKADISLTTYYSKREDSSTYAGFALNNNSLGYAFFPDAPRVTDEDQYGTTPHVGTVTESRGFSAKGEFETDPGTFTIIGSYAEHEGSGLSDLDASPINYFTYEYLAIDQQSLVTEINFASRQFGRMSFIAGGLYIDSDDRFNPSVSAFWSPPTVYPDDTPANILLPSYIVKKKEILAGYAELTAEITSTLTISAGGRWTQEEQEGYRGVTADNLVASKFNGETWREFSPRLTAKYSISPDSNLYASYSEGFRGGQVQTATILSAPDVPPIDPETAASYEIGYKGRLAENLSLNLAVYTYEIENLQLLVYNPTEGSKLQNAAKASGDGLDFDVTWAPSSELTLSAGVAYLDAQYDDFPNGASYVPNPGGGNTQTTKDFSGQRPLRAPKWSGNISASYETELDAGVLGAFATVYSTDDFGLEPDNRISQRSHTSLNAEFSFSPAAVAGMRLVLWGKNLTDEEYLTNAIVTGIADFVTYGDPRTYGLRAEYDF
jgi:iron complex outermembrane receptor protein